MSCGSASIDPHISVAAAEYQVARAEHSLREAWARQVGRYADAARLQKNLRDKLEPDPRRDGDGARLPVAARLRFTVHADALAFDGGRRGKDIGAAATGL